MRRTSVAAALLLLLAGCHAQVPESVTADEIAPAGAAKPNTARAALNACRRDLAGLVVTTERGIGGTGVNGSITGGTAVSSSGIGGTGMVASGIGGTGVSSSGIGGTGVVASGIGGTGVRGLGGEHQDYADRGIGGTGVDGIGGTGIDGIGGTGIIGSASRIPLTLRGRGPNDRNDDGTGVIGTVTGFRSLCVNGLEVGLQGLARLNQDGTPLATVRLQLGEVAAIDTRGTGSAIHAVGIGIRHEVMGPITAIVRAGQDIEVAGQDVLIGDDTNGRDAFPTGLKLGDWVSVSGLRDLAGAIHASRLDPGNPGEVAVAGIPEQRGGEWLLGRLHLRFAGKLPSPGQRVLVSGRLAGATLEVDRLAEDRLVASGHGAQHLIVEGYALVAGQDLRLGQGLHAALGPRFGAPPPADRPAIVDFVADSDNNMVAVSWSLPDLPGSLALPGKPPE